MTTRTFVASAAALALAGAACSNTDPTSSGGSGSEHFTTWGEAFVEQGIPAGDGTSGFLDGWSLHYDKFLVNFHGITVADDAGDVGYQLAKPVFVDNTKVGEKELVPSFSLPAKAWTKVSYQIKPAVADETLAAGADPSDLAMMVKAGYSFYVAGSAKKTDSSGKALTKSFHWGFKTATQYSDCEQPPDSGLNVFGIVITDGGEDTTQLTTHGDHLYYDRLQASPDAAVKTLLRFDQKAAADDAPNGDGDGEITLQELCKEQLDPATYDPSGFNVATIGDFMIDLARTIGHFRHEGECTISGLEATKAKLPCDDYR